MSNNPRARVLLLHGFLATHEVWSPLRRHASDEVDLVTPDLLGYGRSRTDDELHTLDTVVADLMTVVEREQPTHVVGHSMGGIAALALAARMPGQFQSLGLIALPVFGNREEGEAFLGRRGILRRMLLAKDVVSHFWCRVLHGTRLAWPPIVGPFSVTPRRILTSMFDHNEAAHVGGLDELVFAGAVPNLAEAVRTPVSMFHGTHDHTSPVQSARELSEHHGWQFEHLEGARHQLIIDRPERTWEWMQRTVLKTNAPTAVSSAASPRTLV